MFNNFEDAKNWFNESFVRFSVEFDKGNDIFPDCVIIFINVEYIDSSGFSVGSDDFPYKSFDSKHDFISYCDVLKFLMDMGVNYFESEY